jgi:hypothetical protein
MEEREKRRELKRIMEEENLNRGGTLTASGKPRKKNVRRDAPKANASQAILSSSSVVGGRRSSKKINYDALLSVFGDDGNYVMPEVMKSTTTDPVQSKTSTETPVISPRVTKGASLTRKLHKSLPEKMSQTRNTTAAIPSSSIMARSQASTQNKNARNPVSEIRSLPATMETNQKNDNTNIPDNEVLVDNYEEEGDDEELLYEHEDDYDDDDYYYS